jgi:hypothetical protein
VDDHDHSTYAERYATTKAAIDARSCPLCGAAVGELCFAEDTHGQVIRAVDVTHLARLADS